MLCYFLPTLILFCSSFQFNSHYFTVTLALILSHLQTPTPYNKSLHPAPYTYLALALDFRCHNGAHLGLWTSDAIFG